MAANKHIEQIGDLDANIRANLDTLQIAIQTDDEETFVWADDGADKYFYAARQYSKVAGGAKTYLDNEFNKITLHGNLIIPDAGNIGSVSDTDSMAIGAGGIVSFSAGINNVGASLLVQDDAAQDVELFASAAGGETPTFQISGFRNVDAKRTLTIGVSGATNNALEFKGLSDYIFDGDLNIPAGGEIGCTGDFDLMTLNIGALTLAGTLGCGAITSTGAIADGAASTFTTGATIGNLTLADGSITDSGGAITFVNENLSTTGTFSCGVPTFTVADESADTTCFPLFATAATGGISPKTGTNLLFNASVGTLTVGDGTASASLNLDKGGGGTGRVTFVRGATTDWYLGEESGEGFEIVGVRADEDFFIRVNDGGATKTVMTIDSSAPRILFENLSYTTFEDSSVGIGNFGGAGPSAPLHVLEENAQDVAMFEVASNTAADDPNIKFRRSRGTFATPLDVVNADDIGHFLFRGYVGGWDTPAEFGCIVDGAVTATGDNDIPGMLVFATSPGGGVDRVDRWFIRASGNLEGQADNQYIDLGAGQDSGIADSGTYMLFDCDRQSATGRWFSLMNGPVGVGFLTLPDQLFEVRTDGNAITRAKVTNTAAGTASQASFQVKSEVSGATFSAYSSTHTNTEVRNKAVLFAETNTTGLMVGAIGAAANIGFYVGGLAAGDKKVTIAVDGDIVTVGLTHVQAQDTTARSMANAAWTDAIFSIEDDDTLGEYDNATGIFTAGHAGTYICTWRLDSASAVWTVNESWRATLSINNSTAEGGQFFGNKWEAQTSFTGPARSGGTAIVKLAATDTLRIKAYQTQGAAVNTAGNEKTCYLHIARII